MPTFKLDGQEIPFEPGETIMKAAWRQGIEIPHYCWHPGLSIAANCRMCLVEIRGDRPGPQMPILKWDASKKAYVNDTKPKLMPACQMPAVEGQEVFAKNEQALEAQSHVQEFLLLNHPVDCPICDQAGECKLQDYYVDHQATAKRKDTEPVHKVKGERFGDTIVYDGERCVMCTRCIRFCDEVAGDSVLDMRERGNKNEIVLAPGRELDHGYTLMTEHVCPVGALTSRDFRFKARVWFLRTVDGVCEGCATGCNSYVDYDPRHNRVYRLRPRDNAQVNQFWMCDDGMMTYKRYHEERVTEGRTPAGDTTPEGAVQAAADALRGISGERLAIVLSAQQTTEDNLVLVKLAKEKLGAGKFYLAANGGWEGDDILRHSDNNPNRAGAELVAGGPLSNVAQLLADVSAGSVDGVLMIGSVAAETSEQLAPLKNLETTVTLAANEGPLVEAASIVVPIASHAETVGTFINAKGQAQTFKRALRAPAGIKSGWETLVDLAAALGHDLALKSFDDVRGALPAPEAAPAAASAEAQV